MTNRAKLGITAAAAIGAIALPALLGWSRSAEAAVNVPPAALVEHSTNSREVAVIAGGCFWGVEGVFEHVRGVRSAVSGYSGGSTRGPDYEQVSSGRTGHAETVKVVFDPRTVSYGQLLQVYFSVVTDPTQLNRQGPDTGTQYRTALFPVSTDQARQAKAYIGQLGRAHAYSRPIVTRIEPFKGFTAAEAYHQDFMRKNPAYPYIVVNDAPKVAALKRYFPGLWRA